MVRIAGVDLPRNKRIEVGLTYIYGIGRKTSNDILRKAGVDPDKRDTELTESEVSAIRDIIDREYIAQSDRHGHQAADRDRLVPWATASPESAGTGPAHPDERAHQARPS